MELLRRPEALFLKPLMSLSIMQWNTLAEDLAKDFPAVEPKYLSWSYRSPLHLMEIQNISADIICLQEVDNYHSFFHPRLQELGYAGVYQCKGGWHKDGCCIFYKNTFSKLQDYTLHFPGNQVAIGVLLQYNSTQFYVFSTHLKSKVGNDNARDVQVIQLLEYLSVLEPYPMFICGDFNSMPGSSSYWMMKNNELGLKSAYEIEGNEPEFTTVKQRETMQKKTEDYIWHRGATLHGTLPIFSLDSIGPSGLPSLHYPSDHISLSAAFSFSQSPGH